jgi:CheY-like chemotaxis protein
LDIDLPDIEGWTVLEELKDNLETRHIPVHIITAKNERIRGLQMGAKDFLEKPVNKYKLMNVIDTIKNYDGERVRNLLVACSNVKKSKSIVKLIEYKDDKIVVMDNGEKAIEELKKHEVDCIILDLELPDMNGFELIKVIQKDIALMELPIIIYKEKVFEIEEENEIKLLSNNTIIKEAVSPEHLLDETALFLHRVTGNLSKENIKLIEKAHKTKEGLTSKKVMIVDDERNIFALKSMLERYGMEVISAENGMLAIENLKKNPDTDIILMDIMMPIMDGYETMRAIRKISKYKSIPIIALTAKAMKGDREKCIEAGASDYIPKPVEKYQLISLLRVWLGGKQSEKGNEEL